jgi:hypothetical protein
MHDPFTEKYKRGIGIREGWERYFTGHQNISMATFFSPLLNTKRALTLVHCPYTACLLTVNSGVPPCLWSMKPFTSVLFILGIVIVIDFNKI